MGIPLELRFAGVKATILFVLFRVLKTRSFEFLDFLGFLAISREWNELPDIHWCHVRTSKYLGLSNFQKSFKIGFWNLWISVLFGQILGTKRAHQRSAIVKTTRFFRAFQIFKKVGVLAFWISGYFWISGHISGTKSATGGLLERILRYLSHHYQGRCIITFIVG